MIKIVEVKSDDDSSESHNLQNEEINVNLSLMSHHGRTAQRKTKKFVVSLEKPAKTSYNLPHRGQRRNRVSKFQVQHNVPTGVTSSVQSTRRPKLMQTKKFTSKPHAIDHAEELLQRSNFIKRRSQSNFNQLRNEEKHKVTDKNNHKNSDHFENRFQNFTDIDSSSENDSDESKKPEKPLRRRYMKTAASDKVKAIASPPFVNVNTQRNYKIRELLKNQKYNPRVERKMVPVLALQKGSGVMIGGQNETAPKNIEESSTRKNGMSPEENADQNEFMFIKEDKIKSSTTASPKDDEIVTGDPLIV